MKIRTLGTTKADPLNNHTELKEIIWTLAAVGVLAIEQAGIWWL